HHAVLRTLYEAEPHFWILPWAILPEVDSLLLTHVGAHTERLFVADLVEGRYAVEWHSERDLARAVELNARYAELELGLVDALVIAMAERLRADAIATLDIRDFGAVDIVGAPRLIPRDL
ncbi:MAG: PIN domain-containing protein, partial [Gemmatimonadetes bacterium]|nr:PIN domain-containing protein [Gemmatimonadota bacterium]